MELLDQISERLQKGRADEVRLLVQQAIDEGISAQTILQEGLISGMGIIGERFKKNEVFVPDILAAARAMNQGASLLKPLLAADGVKAVGRVCIGTVRGDLHDIGKNLVVLMLKNYGYNVIDLGKDVPSALIVETAMKEHAKVIGLSALMTTTMMRMKEVVELAKEKGCDSKIVIGGAAINESFADEIGADGYSKDAADCVKLVDRLLEE